MQMLFILPASSTSRNTAVNQSYNWTLLAGPSNIYFAVGEPLLFWANMTFGTESPLTYSFTFGDNSSLISTLPTVTHTFTAPGVYTIGVNASNPLSNEAIQSVNVYNSGKSILTQFGNIVLQYPVSTINVALDGPFPMNYTFTATLSVSLPLATNACYALDFGETQTYSWMSARYTMFGDSTACSNFQPKNISMNYFNNSLIYLTSFQNNTKISFSHTYFTIGVFPVTFQVINSVSSAEATISAIVTIYLCSYPTPDIKNKNGCSGTNCDSTYSPEKVKAFLRSEPVTLDSQVTFNCSGVNAAVYQWDFEYLNSSLNPSRFVNYTPALQSRYLQVMPNSTDSQFIQLINSPISPNVLFPALSFYEYGIFRVTLNVSMINETGLWRTDQVNISFVPSPIRACINDPATYEYATHPIF